MPRMKLSRPWTGEEDTVVLQMRGEVRSFFLIAARLRRSVKGVESRYRLMRLRAREDLAAGAAARRA
jgi:hypothetical protein